MSFGRLLRLAMHILGVVWALAIGGVVRLVRRVLGRPPRIWHGPLALHLIKGMVLADQAAGYSSRAVVSATSPSRFGLIRASEFDVVWEAGGLPPSEWPWANLRDLVRHADVWVAFFDSHIFSAGQRRANDWAMAAVRWAGIRIVAVPHGMDVLCRDQRVTRFDWVGRAQLDYPEWDLRKQKDLANWRINLFCRHSRLVISGDSTTSRFLPRIDVTFKYFPAEPVASAVAERPAHRCAPLVIHAPQHRHIKGTDALLAAADHLRARGFTFELQLVERTPRHEAQALYAAADIIADQFCMGAFGMFALEGLALGKPVVTYLDQEHLGDPAFNLPLVNAHPGNLALVLAALIAVPDLRSRLGRAGRESVAAFQSPAVIGEVWDRIYQNVWWGAPLDLRRTRHFSTRRGTRAFTEDPNDSQFWPVQASDLLAAIRAAVAEAH